MIHQMQGNQPPARGLRKEFADTRQKMAATFEVLKPLTTDAKESRAIDAVESYGAQYDQAFQEIAALMRSLSRATSWR